MKARTVLERHTYICLGVLLTFFLETKSQVSLILFLLLEIFASQKKVRLKFFVELFFLPRVAFAELFSTLKSSAKVKGSVGCSSPAQPTVCVDFTISAAAAAAFD